MIQGDWIKQGAECIMADPKLYALAKKAAIEIAIINKKEMIEKEQTKLKELEDMLKEDN